MSEFVQLNSEYATFRWRLLTGASALVLATFVSSWDSAVAEDVSQPSVWIELDGQFNFTDSSSKSWTPPNLPSPIDHPVVGILGQKARLGYDTSAKITLQPDISDWRFSASVRYGKASHTPKFAHDQTYKTKIHYAFSGVRNVLTTYAFTDLHLAEEVQHLIVDFQVGRDVGLGLFGDRGSSTIDFGIRVAQFRERTDVKMTAQVSVPNKYAGLYYSGKVLDAYMHSTRSFSGVGPSISWNDAVSLAGSLEDGLAFDWGANASVLIGRQKATVRSHSRENGYVGATPSGNHLISAAITQVTKTFARNRTVVVPNIGAMASLSYRVGGRGKISLGYRADFFFGAMDGGIDERKSYNVGFHGPFAAISIGLGG